MSFVGWLHPPCDLTLRIHFTPEILTMSILKDPFTQVEFSQLCDHILVFVFGASLYAAVVYNLGVFDTRSQAFIGLGFVAALCAYGYFARAEWRTALSAVVFIALALYVYGHLREFSYDGLVYHAATPLRLDQNTRGYVDTNELTGMFWSDHYPKAFEFFAYTARQLTGQFNSGKAFTLLLSVPAVFAMARLFQTVMQSRRMPFIAAAACIYNPVTIAQITTLYVDAAHYFCWAIFSINVLFAARKQPYSAIQLGTSLALLLTSKMTGAVFAAIPVLVFLAVALLTGERKELFRKYRLLVGQMAVWSLVAIATIGYSPYVQNVEAGRNVLYPLLGANKVDIMEEQMPPRFSSMGRAQKFVAAHFSVPRNSVTEDPTFVPSPAHLHEAFVALHFSDTRFGALGPFFGVMVIISLLPFFWKRKQAGIMKMFLAATLLIVLIHPESWWARYVPMLYAVPFLIAGAFSESRLQFRAITAFAVMNTLVVMASVGAYMVLKQGHYASAVASVRELCGEHPVSLQPSLFNWQFDLRDDHLLMKTTATTATTAAADCDVSFDKMMVMKKY